MGTKPRKGSSLLEFGFAFSVTLGLLSVVSTVVGYVIALVRGGGLGDVRFAPWVAAAGLAAAAVIARHIVRRRRDRRQNTSNAFLTAGVAGAGGLVLIGSLARDIANPGEIGPVQIAVAAIAVVTIISSPIAGRAVARYGLIDRFAWFTTDEQSEWVAGRPATTGLRPWEMAAAVVGLVVLAAALAYVMSPGPLGHDESVYAAKARSWYAGTPATGFGTYRPPGLAVVGWVVLHFSDSEIALRSVAIVLAVGTVAAMWIAGRTMLSPSAAWIGAGVFVASASYLRRATEFLNDLPAAALLLATMLVIWYHFERRPDGWWIVAAAPLGAAAYYVRYGSAPGLAIIAIVAAAVWCTRLRYSWRQIAVTAGVMIALLIPHFLYSVTETGSFLGIFGSARTSVGGGGGGLADYVDWFPEHLAGHLGAGLMTAGIVFTIALAIGAVWRRAWPQVTRTSVFLTGTAIPFTIVLGIFTHGEPRFVFMPIMALLLVGGQAVVAVLIRLSTIPRRVVTVVLGLVIVGAFAPGPSDMRRATDFITAQYDVVVEAADAIRSDAGTDNCAIRSSYVPQLTWYSECATFSFADGFPAGENPAYMVLFKHGKRQPQGADLDTALATTPGTPFALIVDTEDRVGDAFIYHYGTGGG